MKKILKCNLALVIVVALILGFCGFAQAVETVTVYVDGEMVEFDVAPRIMDGRTMVPIRAIFEALGAEVEWYAEEKTAVALKDGFVISLTLGDKLLYIGDSDFMEMDIAPVNIDGRILVPARFAGEAFSCEVEWDGATKTVTICSKDYLESIAG